MTGDEERSALERRLAMGLEEPEGTSDRTPCACPWCGHSGAFDGLGKREREFKRVGPDSCEWVHQVWDQMHCPECGGMFSLCREGSVEDTRGMGQ